MQYANSVGETVFSSLISTNSLAPFWCVHVMRLTPDSNLITCEPPTGLCLLPCPYLTQREIKRGVNKTEEGGESQRANSLTFDYQAEEFVSLLTRSNELPLPLSRWNFSRKKEEIEREGEMVIYDRHGIGSLADDCRKESRAGPW